MSTIEAETSTFGQAAHTLTIIGQQQPTAEDLKVLHDGYLADLIRAIKNGTVPVREDFQKTLGLRPEFQVWKTVVLGRHKTVDAYRKSIKAQGRQVGDYANQLADKTPISGTQVEVDLVRASARQLGFKGNARYDAIVERAQSYGLEKCMAEAGLALADQYPDQPSGDNAIAMDAITDLGDDLRIFNVNHVLGERRLGTCHGRPDSVYDPDHVFVWVLPRKQQFWALSFSGR
ncbi:MAG: hypothetical protein AAB479_00185 [Patescibacteria group bacterium]